MVELNVNKVSHTLTLKLTDSFPDRCVEIESMGLLMAPFYGASLRPALALFCVMFYAQNASRTIAYDHQT